MLVLRLSIPREAALRKCPALRPGRGRQQHRDKDNPTPHFPTPFTFLGYRPAMDDLAKKTNFRTALSSAGGLRLFSSPGNILVLATDEGQGC